MLKYKRIIAYIPEVSVLFELEDGTFALVSIDGEEDTRILITISKYAETHLKFGGFKDAKDIPANMAKYAIEILKKGEKIFVSKDINF